jgi:hypothetical protein
MLFLPRLECESIRDTVAFRIVREAVSCRWLDRKHSCFCYDTKQVTRSNFGGSRCLPPRACLLPRTDVCGCIPGGSPLKATHYGCLGTWAGSSFCSWPPSGIHEKCCATEGPFWLSLAYLRHSRLTLVGYLFLYNVRYLKAAM